MGRRGARPRAEDGSHRARVVRETATVVARPQRGCVAGTHREIRRAIVRNWSNTGRGANYPLLRSREPRTDEERSAETQANVVSMPRPFVAARLYWLTKSPVFARRDELRELDERVRAINAPESGRSTLSEGGILRDEGDFWRVRYEGIWIAVRSLKGLSTSSICCSIPKRRFMFPSLLRSVTSAVRIRGDGSG